MKKAILKGGEIVIPNNVCDAIQVIADWLNKDIQPMAKHKFDYVSVDIFPDTSGGIHLGLNGPEYYFIVNEKS